MEDAAADAADEDELEMLLLLDCDCNAFDFCFLIGCCDEAVGGAVEGGSTFWTLDFTCKAGFC